MKCNHNVDLIPDVSEIAALAESVCPVDWAKNCVNIARHNNCGKSVMCRDGMTQLSVLMDDITRGKGEDTDIALIHDLCTVISGAGGCELAEKAAAAVLYSMDKYGEEWELHCRRSRCTALVCKNYYTIVVLPDKCQGAGDCVRVCPEGAIAGGAGLISVINPAKCTRCGKCLEICPNAAAAKVGAVKPRLPEAPVPVGSFDAEGGRRRRRG